MRVHNPHSLCVQQLETRVRRMREKFDAQLRDAEQSEHAALAKYKLGVCLYPRRCMLVPSYMYVCTLLVVYLHPRRCTPRCMFVSSYPTNRECVMIA